MTGGKKADHYFVGIDDTDNINSRGTGYLARQFAHLINESGFGRVDSITRHQLYVHKAIRYTSQNSSACLKVFADDLNGLISLGENYLINNSAPGSDAAMCVCAPDQCNNSLVTWGNDAKNTVLTMETARIIADTSGIYLKGFTGTFEGIIGALAAVGLRAGGNDGRFIWRKRKKELREISEGISTAGQLIADLELDGILSLEGEKPADRDRIMLSNWVRPILKNDQAILIADKNYNNDEYEWKLTSKEIIRTIS